VRGRLSGHLGFVEDLFTVRFNEMMGITSGGRNQVRTLREQMCRCRDESLEQWRRGEQKWIRAEETVTGAHRRPKWVSHCAQADPGRAQAGSGWLRLAQA
jgi:hypothetical protein